MNFFKNITFVKVMNVFVIVGWWYIFFDSARRVIMGPHTNIWIDIVFMVMAIFIVPMFAIEYRNRFIKKK
ncbi:hypothetical protein P9X78_23525 [Bacillus thuringiensis]|nr:hypothetical protein [Bacillus thuringiensis]